MTNAPLTLANYIFVAALAVGLLLAGSSIAAGGDPLDAILLALGAAVAVLVMGRTLIDRLESPEQRLARRRADFERRYRKRRAKKA